MISIGRLVLSIRPLFLWLLALLPCIGTLAIFSVHLQTLNDAEEHFAELCARSRPLCKQYAIQTRWMERYGAATPYFLNQTLETQRFLSSEIDWLHKMANHPALQQRSLLQERLHFLSDNQISFLTEPLQSTPDWKESEERLVHPVQLSEADLWKLLRILDAPNAPQLIILDLQLKKMDFPFHNQGFVCDFRLLKRSSS